jgi:hypothetical protein
MSDRTVQEAMLNIHRDHYEALGKSNHRFAPYVNHIMNRYYDDKVGDWENCKEVLEYILNEEISGDVRINYLVGWHEYPKNHWYKPCKPKDIVYNEKDM